MTAFVALALSAAWSGGLFWSFIPALARAAVPLLALAGVAPGQWRSLFGHVRMRELRLMLGFALLQWFMQGLAWCRKRSVLVAWVCASVLFGRLHLPTYGWNWVQCIVAIGGARMVLTLPWIMAKNLWVSTGAHITNDWLLFALGLWGAGLAGKA